MKSIFEKVIFPVGEGLKAIHFEGFTAPYAHHPEPELVYIHRGAGTRLVGHRVDSFFAGDFVFLSPNIPHWWRPHRSMEFSEGEEATVVQMASSFMTSPLFSMPEFAPLALWMNARGKALAFPTVSKTLIEKFCILPRLSGAQRLLVLLEVLLELQQLPVEHCVDLSYAPLQSVETPSLEMEELIANIVEHLRDPLPQQELAARLKITPVHFSRRFKQSTGMSYPSFVNHLRIAQICQELRLSKRSIANCAFDVGYQNLSNFNRAFREVMGITPMEYRKMF